MSLVVLATGPQMTVQDGGRPGWGRFGVSPSGAMDPLAARAANLLAGNPEDAPLLEITGAGGALRLEVDRRVGLAGGDLGAEIAGPRPRALAPFRAADVAAGQVVRFDSRRRGARAYLALGGGLLVEAVFGSAATDIGSGLGGRALRAGDRIRLGPAAPSTAAAADDLALLLRFYDQPDRLRFVPAPDVPAAALQAFAAARYLVTPRANRVGYALDGPPLPPLADGEPLSQPIAPGTIQVPPDGRPILLMADHQTVGGYPAIGFLARADAPRAAQLWPGDGLSFVATSVEEAQAALRAQRAALRAAAAPPGP